jgi:hypothetical protein
MRSRQRHAALNGLDFGFSVHEVYLRGALAARDGKNVGRASGRMVRPARS